MTNELTHGRYLPTHPPTYLHLLPTYLPYLLTYLPGYLLPAFAHVSAQPTPPRPNGGPRVLVLLPTRELAVQTHAVARSLRKVSGVNSAAVYGGGPREEQVGLFSYINVHIKTYIYIYIYI